MNGFVLPAVEALICATLITAVFYLIRNTFAVVNVRHDSMSPSLCNGDRVLLLKRFRANWLKRGSIVVFETYPILYDEFTGERIKNAQLLIKRVTGLHPDNFHSRCPLFYEFDPIFGLREPTTWTVPQGYVFVEADNRSLGKDSFDFGPIPISRVRGVVLMSL